MMSWMSSVKPIVWCRASGNKYKQKCIGHRMSPVLHNKQAKYDIIQLFFVHPIIKNIIVDMKCALSKSQRWQLFSTKIFKLFSNEVSCKM